MDGRLREHGVVRRGPRADVARRRGQPLSQDGRRATAHLLGNRVELVPIPGRAIQRGNLPRVAEGRDFLVAMVLLVPDLVDDLGEVMSIIVYMSLIDDIIAELIESLH